MPTSGWGITIKGTTPAQAAAKLRFAAGRLPQLVERGVESALRLYVQSAKGQAPVGTHYTRTGQVQRPETLKRSIKFSVSPVSLTGVWGVAYSDAPHVRHLIFGAKRHPIPLQPGRVTFWWPKATPDLMARMHGKKNAGNKLVTFRQVDHPGFRGNPFHFRAFRQSESGMRLAIGNAAKNLRFEIMR
jgi:hypothetical protein